VCLLKIYRNKKISNYVRLLASSRPINSIRTKTREGYYIKSLFPLIKFFRKADSNQHNKAIAIILLDKDYLKGYGSNGVIKNLEKV